MDIDAIKDVQIWSPAARSGIPIAQVVTGFEIAWQDAIVHRRNRVPTRRPPNVGAENQT